jgi:hypothetical protein
MATIVGTSFKNLSESVEEGSCILLSDGLIALLSRMLAAL